MKVMVQGIRAELLKMRHTFLYAFHVAIPLLSSSVFLLYYRFSGWSEQVQIAGYMEVIGMVLPFLVSIICAGNIGLEEQNHFQVFLGSYENKWKGLAVKWMVLVGMCLMAIAGAVILFGMGYHMLLGKEGLSISGYLRMILALFMGSMPLYLEHLFFNLRFSRTVSQCIGVAQSLLSGLFLTGLGDGRWQFFPCTWSARGTMLLYGRIEQNETGGLLFFLKQNGIICLLLFIILCVIIGIWIYYYEGRQYND